MQHERHPHAMTTKVAKNRSCQIEMAGQQGAGGGWTSGAVGAVEEGRPSYPNEPSSPASTHTSSYTLVMSQTCTLYANRYL